MSSMESNRTPKRRRVEHSPGVPGRDTEALPQHIQDEWGKCHQCGQLGHFKRNCPLNSPPVTAKYDSVCALCNGKIRKDVDIITRNDNGDSWLHVRCQLGDAAAQASRASRPVRKSLLGSGSESAHDLAILRFVQGSGHGLIISAAGSGKTYQLVKIYKQVTGQSGVRARVVVFNTDAADELQSRNVPRRDARTFHSFGHQSWIRAKEASGKQVKVDAKKIRGIVIALYPIERCEAPKTGRSKRSIHVSYFGTAVEKLVSLARQQGVGIAGMMQDTEEEWIKLYQRYDVRNVAMRAFKRLSKGRQEFAKEKWQTAVVTREFIVGLSREVLGESVKIAMECAQGVSVIDFDDQLYMPLLNDCDMGTQDWVLVDEAQDSNPIRRLAAVRMLKKDTGRLLAVGDPCQAINAWCGAADDALAMYQRELNIPQENILYLPECRRCPALHVELANSLIDEMNKHMEGAQLPHMQPMDGAPPGIVIHEADFVSHSPLQNGNHAILCRKNAPLLRLQYVLARHGIGCRMRGRKALVKALTELVESTVKALSIVTLRDLCTALPALCEAEDDDIDSNREQSLKSDLAQCILAIINKMHLSDDTLDGPLEPLFQELQAMYDQGDGMKDSGLLTLSTVHKAKGLEYKRVYILEPATLKLPHIMHWGKQWQRQEERNIEYVACTRAYEELVFLKDVGIEHLDTLFQEVASEAEDNATGSQEEDYFDSWREYCEGQRGEDDPEEEKEHLDPYKVLGLEGSATLQEARQRRAQLLKGNILDDYH